MGEQGPAKVLRSALCDGRRAGVSFGGVRGEMDAQNGGPPGSVETHLVAALGMR